ncbi:hypothetical protein [Streptomyces orinoci]|uniref:Uncharacterized protein n=1 Tax=Streptomyces orinoci TaxID=67339 RepID=A0ABV3K6V2_STRON|nr:hypothetical protein [Streptomyces orinoci]
MTDSWVGGDIGGLAAMGLAYTDAEKDLNGPLKPLGTSVDSLVKVMGWQGESATAFLAKWSTDAMTAGAFSAFVSSVGKVLTDLSNDLKTAESALHNAEDVAVRAGVTMRGQGQSMDPPAGADDKVVKARNEYETARAECLHTAQKARIDAARRLNALYDQVTATSGLQTGDKVTLADYLRGLYAIDAEAHRAKGDKAAAQLDSAKKEMEESKKALQKEVEAFTKEGKSLPAEFPAKSRYADAIKQVMQLDATIKDAGSGRLPADGPLNVKVADAAEALKMGRGLEALPKFLREIPVVDVAAAGACGILGAQTDHDRGMSWKRSLVINGTSNFGGLAAGTAVTALALADAPVAVAAGVGGVVVIGSTMLIDNALHEHWKEDIHDHGVIGGIAFGSKHIASETAHDGWNLVKGAGKGVWHGLKSIF